MPTVSRVRRITRQNVRANPKTVYVFGDNMPHPLSAHNPGDYATRIFFSDALPLAVSISAGRSRNAYL